MQEQHDYIRGVIEKYGLTVETKDVPEEDPGMLFVKYTDFAKLKAIADEVKKALGDEVKFATYYPVSGLMNELILGFMIVDKTPV